MGDIRFTMVGIVLIFVGFVIFGAVGNEYRFVSIESDEFGTCYRYFDDAEPIKVDCSYRMGEQIILFGVVIALFGSGVISLIKGIRGNWDSKVRPEDMVGPQNNFDTDKKDKPHYHDSDLNDIFNDNDDDNDDDNNSNSDHVQSNGDYTDTKKDD